MREVLRRRGSPAQQGKRIAIIFAIYNGSIHKQVLNMPADPQLTSGTPLTPLDNPNNDILQAQQNNNTEGVLSWLNAGAETEKILPYCGNSVRLFRLCYIFHYYLEYGNLRQYVLIYLQLRLICVFKSQRG
jgi:hypothetical protein